MKKPSQNITTLPIRAHGRNSYTVHRIIAYSMISWRTVVNHWLFEALLPQWIGYVMNRLFTDSLKRKRESPVLYGNNKSFYQQFKYLWQWIVFASLATEYKHPIGDTTTHKGIALLYNVVHHGGLFLPFQTPWFISLNFICVVYMW